MPKIIGRTACKFCGFDAAHVKRGDDGKRAYVHCPDCGLLTQARSGHQEALLLQGMRDATAAPPPPPPAAPPAPNERSPLPIEASTLPPAARARPGGLWDQLMGRPS